MKLVSAALRGAASASGATAAAAATTTTTAASTAAASSTAIRVSSATASRRVYTLFLVRQHDQLLLGMKKRGFGVGLWQAFGGKVEPGETIDAAAVRELREESGLEVGAYRKFAVVTYDLVAEDHVMEGHLYASDEPRGQPVETDEMRPQWFPLDALPFDKMFADAPLWMPFWQRGQRFVAYFKFPSNDVVSEHTIRPISDPNERLEPIC